MVALKNSMDNDSIPFEKNLDHEVYEAHSINISPGKNMLKTIKQKAPFWFPCCFTWVIMK